MAEPIRPSATTESASHFWKAERSTSKASESSEARTVAVRGVPCRSAISPNDSPRVSERSSTPPADSSTTANRPVRTT